MDSVALFDSITVKNWDQKSFLSVDCFSAVLSLFYYFYVNATISL
jgi:hypothetical protein